MPLMIPYHQSHFSAAIAPLDVNFAFRQNDKEYQEDRLFIDVMPGFQELSYQQQEYVLLRAFKNTQTEIENQKLLGGSIAIVCISYIEKKDDQAIVHIITANLADSAAYYVLKDKNTGKPKRCQRLNPHLHKPKDPRERKHITDAKHSVNQHNGLLDGQLSVARSFGDLIFDSGVNHEPDISHQEIPLAEDEELLLIAASDGIIPVAYAHSDVVEGDDTKTISTCCRHFSDKKIAEYLVTKQSMTDNSLVVTHTITASSKPNSESAGITVPVMIDVFDGHDGNKVSDFAANYLPDRIFSEIQNEQASLQQKQQLLDIRTNIMVSVETAYNEECSIIERNKNDYLKIVLTIFL